jgi:hypothetical protein
VAAGLGEIGGAIGRIEGGEVDVLDLPPALVVHGVAQLTRRGAVVVRQASSLVSGVLIAAASAIEEYSRRSGLVLEELEDEMDIRIYRAPRPVAGAPAAGAGGLITAPSQCSISLPLRTRKVSKVNTS